MASYEFAYVMEDLGFALIPGLLSGIPSFAFGIATYVLTALALYTLASRRGISHAWLSWVPVLNVWVLGSLSDQYRYVVKGQIKSKRKSLLILNLINAIIGVMVTVFAVALVIGMIRGAAYNMDEDALLEMILGPALGMVGLCLPMIGICVAIVVLRYMALYDVYTSMDPGNNVLFLVLSILFSVTEPFFLFFNRNKDLGMPPRRQEPVYTPPQPPVDDWMGEC